MWWRFLLAGVLAAAPLLSHSADPTIRDGEFVWFTLAETHSALIKLLGAPATVADFGADFEAWQYHLGPGDHHDFSHYFVFRKSTGSLVSVTRSWESDQEVDAYFPPQRTSVCTSLSNGQITYGARVRNLGDGRLLIAMGSLKQGERSSQLLLIRDSELRYFHPWLYPHPGKTELRRTPE